MEKNAAGMVDERAVVRRMMDAALREMGLAAAETVGQGRLVALGGGAFEATLELRGPDVASVDERIGELVYFCGRFVQTRGVPFEVLAADIEARLDAEGLRLRGWGVRVVRTRHRLCCCLAALCCLPVLCVPRRAWPLRVDRINAYVTIHLKRVGPSSSSTTGGPTAAEPRACES